MITSLTPKLRRRDNAISSSVCPSISTSALGRSSVRGRSRVPNPAPRIIALIDAVLSSALSSIQLLLLAMMQHNFDSIMVSQMLCQLFRQIHRTVLSARASERHHQVLKAAALVGVDT